MAYTINLTDGTIFATIADGTINTSSSMTLVGKNYAGYGEFLDENFIHLLENSSNTTAPGAPLEGQIWWNSGSGILNVYSGAGWKRIGGATAEAFPGPSGSNSETGDLWYDTTNAQLKVYTGTAWLLVGPAFTAGTGTTGAIVDTIVDNTAVSHVVIKFYVEDSVIAIMSKDAAFTPQSAIPGWGSGQQVKPGMTMSSASASYLFQGTATDAQTLDGIDSTGFLSATSNDTTSGTLGILNDSGLTVGADSDAKLSVSGAGVVTLSNQTSGQNMTFSVNVGGVPTTALTISGANGNVSGNQINANYADVAERFAADEIYEAGTVVELGGANEITRVTSDLSDKVFGVISTRAAYLMNSNAGSDETHPPVAMTGRVPVKVIGIINKGDRLVSAGNGYARAAQVGEATAFNVIGRSLTAKLDSGEGTVEAIVTIK
jgi:hypothetical protein